MTAGTSSLSRLRPDYASALDVRRLARITGANDGGPAYRAIMSTYRPFHLPECPARDGRVALESCTCPLWRFLDPASRLDEPADSEGAATG
jgi:hypothetical protein